jgi:hypothetical protein
MVKEKAMRYRITNGEGKYWDAEDKRWRSELIGYTTYKSFAAAVAAGRRTKAPIFSAYSVRVIEDA